MIDNESTFSFSQETDKIFPALVAVLHKLPQPGKTQTGYQDAYKYASLPKLISSVRGILAEHGLAIIQPISNSSPEKISVRTILIHETGQYISSVSTMGPVKVPSGGPGQAYGAGVSYLRRYSLEAMLSIAETLDLDGTGEIEDNGHDTIDKSDDLFNDAMELLQRAQKSQTKQQVRDIYAAANAANLLKIITPKGPLGEQIKSIAVNLPE